MFQAFFVRNRTLTSALRQWGQIRGAEMSLSGTGSDPKRWREWARTTRSIATQMKTETSRQNLKTIADMYDRAADRIEDRDIPRKTKPSAS
jgi:hypothetical protein